MRTEKLYFMECHVAGCQYHDADEVWEELKVGKKLQLVREKENRFDPNAVAIVYNKPIDGEFESKPFILGYVPSGENKEIAAFLEIGWDNIFECRISKLNEDTHYEDQIHVIIKIKRNNL